MVVANGGGDKYFYISQIILLRVYWVSGIIIRVSRDREIKTRKVQGVRLKEITRSELLIAIVAQCYMSIP